MSTTQTYYLWVTVLSDSLKPVLVSKLIDKGLKVGPLSGAGDSQWNCEASCLLGFTIEVNPTLKDLSKIKSPADFIGFVKDVLSEVSMLYHSVIVYALSVAGATPSFSWCGGNITFPKVDTKPTRFDRVDGE